MDDLIKDMIEALQVEVRYETVLKKDAYYFPSIDLIIINSSQTEVEQQKSLLHELGHAAKHRNNYHLYNLAFCLHSKMENEADEFMVEKMIEIRSKDSDFDPNTFNSINFLESYNFDLRYEPVVKEFMMHYLFDGSRNKIFF